MKISKKTIETTSRMLLLSGVACLPQIPSEMISGVFGGAAGVLVPAIGGLAINWLSKDLQDISPNKNLEKVVNEAVVLTIKTISEEYNSRFKLNKKARKELKKTTEYLVKSIENSSDINYNNLEKEEINNTLNLSLKELPAIDVENPFCVFLEDKFQQTVKLSLYELLGKDKNESAWKEVILRTDEELKKNVKTILEQQETLFKALSSTHKTQIKEELENLSSSNINYKSVLEQQLEELHRDNKEISGKLDKILRENDKFKLYLTFPVIVIALIIITFSLFFYYNRPFQVNIAIQKNEKIRIQQEYPKCSNNARLRFYFPKNTIEKEITSLNEIILNDLDAKLKEEKIKVELLDEYWETSEDSLLLKDGNITVFIQPNNKLAMVEGTVKDRFGNPIVGVTVKVENLLQQTDTNGRYSLKIPINLRKKQYEIRVEKQGYISANYEYIAGNNKEIRLTKN